MVALYNAAGLTSPALYGRRMEEVLLKRRIAVLVATASLVVMMLVAMAPVAMASNAGGFHLATPPNSAPGNTFRNEAADEADPNLHQAGPRAEGCNSPEANANCL